MMNTQVELDMQLNSAKSRFPFKLHQMLIQAEMEGNASIVSWLPNGKAFKVHNKPSFVENILPYVFKTNKYKSFQRNLNLWGFESIMTGPNKGAIFHPFFVRGQPALCRHMNRKCGLGGKPDEPERTLESTSPSSSGLQERMDSPACGMQSLENTLDNSQNQIDPRIAAALSSLISPPITNTVFSVLPGVRNTSQSQTNVLSLLTNSANPSQLNGGPRGEQMVESGASAAAMLTLLLSYPHLLTAFAALNPGNVTLGSNSPLIDQNSTNAIIAAILHKLLSDQVSSASGCSNR